MKLGDAVAVFAQPIARGIDHVFGTDLEHCAGCQGRKEFLNNFSVFDLLRSKKQPTGKTEDMEPESESIDWQLIVVVTATDIKSAIDGVASGKVISANPRPRVQFGGVQPGQPGQPGNLGQTIVRGTPQ